MTVRAVSSFFMFSICNQSEIVETSVIVNDGARLQSSNCVFLNNVAEVSDCYSHEYGKILFVMANKSLLVTVFSQSIIKSESGTIAISGTEFTSNFLTGDSGVVELDSASALELNEYNCDRSAATAIEDAAIGAPASSRRADVIRFNNTGDISSTAHTTVVNVASPVDNTTSNAASSSCVGILSGGNCYPFGESCDAKDEFEGQDVGCFSTWDSLVQAVRVRPDNELDFTICPGSLLDVEASNVSSPVVIDSDYIAIRCGAEGYRSDKCVISGGFSHFQIVGSSSGVELSGLTMKLAKGSSIIAAGSTDATLHLRDCEWTVRFALV